uniref:PR domain zinc finger protein 4 n=1 Tax=Strigamia maritima TaxID=126957 RepID=T1J1Z7_STRMM
MHSRLLRRQTFSQDLREEDETNEEEEEEEEEEEGEGEEYEQVSRIPALKVTLKSCYAGNSSSSRQIVCSSQRHHDSNKSALFRSRVCGDCGLKHSMGECPLQTPTLVVSDSPYDPEMTLVQAEATLPQGLKLETVDKIHGPGIFATEKIHRYTQFGPLVGRIVSEAEISEDANLKNVWEVFGETKTYLDTSDPASSNWLRYMRPAMSRDDRNIATVTKMDGRLYFVTIHDVTAGSELFYWSEDPSVTWSKKKLEKTSCGGCNQRFEHPLYYRMHCMIFHDPNFSLTIRKYHCKVCGVAVLGKENIMKHAMEMHDGKGAYQCQYCKKFFLRLNYLEMHRTYGCRLNPQRSRPLCDLCGKKFCQPQKLKVHIRRMHSDMSEVLKEFQCKSCFKLLGSRAALQRHLKEVHNKDQNIAATCDRCGKTFQNKSNLKIHMLTHSGVKPFRCCESGCTAAFTTKQCLQFHYKKVHGYGMHNMPPIERCVAYTFESYSGGLVSGYEKISESKTKTRKDRGLMGSETSRDTIGLGGSEDSSDVGVGKSFHITPKLVEAALKTMDPAASPLPHETNASIKQEGASLHSSVLDSASENSTIDSHLQDVSTPITSNVEMQGATSLHVDSPALAQHQEMMMESSGNGNGNGNGNGGSGSGSGSGLDACKEMDMVSLKPSVIENLGRHMLQRQASLLAFGLPPATSRSMNRMDPLQQLEHDLELGRHTPDMNQYSNLALCLARQRAEMNLVESEAKHGRLSENGNLSSEQQQQHQEMNLGHLSEHDEHALELLRPAMARQSMEQNMEMEHRMMQSNLSHQHNMDALEMRHQLEHEMNLSQQHAVSEMELHLDLSQRSERSSLNHLRSSSESMDHHMDMSPHTPQLASPLRMMESANELIHPLSRQHGYGLGQHRASLPCGSPLTRHQDQSLDMSCHTSNLNSPNMNSPTPSHCSDLPSQDAALELSRQCDTPAELARPPSHSIDLSSSGPHNRARTAELVRTGPGPGPADILANLEAGRMVCSSGYQAYSPPVYQAVPPAHMFEMKGKKNDLKVLRLISKKGHSAPDYNSIMKRVGKHANSCHSRTAPFLTFSVPMLKTTYLNKYRDWARDSSCGCGN